MKIHIWGCRGSIPAPGAETLRYGGNSTCLEITSAKGSTLVVDAGSGIRLLGKKLLRTPGPQELCLLLTHSHWDHLMGFPFFTPAYFSRFTINVCGGPQAQDSLSGYLRQQMSAPFFPVEFSVMKANFLFKCQCTSGKPPAHGVGVRSIPLSHPNGGYGFRFTDAGRSFVFLTDNELDFRHPGSLERKDYLEACRGADLLIHDAQYCDEEYKITRGWGHSTYESTTRFAMEAGVGSLLLFHHDPDRTDDDLERWTDFCRNLISKEGVKMECHAAREGMEIPL